MITFCKLEVVLSYLVMKLLTNLNASKAAGPDQLSGRLLKATARESAEILQVIFQRSIDEGVLPEDWKKALITPVYKKASRSNPANYRPVSLTCISCKLLEHIVNRHILNHLDAHKILADSQHGFRKRRSRETQLLLTCHDLTREIDKCEQVDMLVFMGVRRNFSRGERAPKRPPSRRKRPPLHRISASAVLGGSEACSPEKILIMVLPITF